MIVESGYSQAIAQCHAHHWIDLVFQHNQIAYAIILSPILASAVFAAMVSIFLPLGSTQSSLYRLKQTVCAEGFR
jgi:hypothetical protein